MVQQNINMRDYSITRNKGEWYYAKVTDSYGNTYDNYFEFAHEANDWIYHIWDNEGWHNSVDSHELLHEAILNCKEIDNKLNIRKIL